MGLFAGSGITPSLRGLVSNVITLPPSGSWSPTPAGWYEIHLGKVSVFQEYDPITQIWRTMATGYPAGMRRFYADGTNNYRITNLSGCAVGAIVTTAGSAYTTPPVITPSAGGSIWRAVIGGAVNTTVTVTNGGSNYTYPPIVIFQAPPPGGVQATGHAVLTAGAVSSIVVDNQGAGYVSPPIIALINDTDEGLNGTGVGSGASAIATLTGAGQVTAVLCVDPGNALTAVPTLSFSSGSAAATVVMCFAALNAGTSVATTAGAGWLTLNGASWPPAATWTNPATEADLVPFRPAYGWLKTASPSLFFDPGVAPAVPIIGPTASAGALTLAVGGINDTSFVFST